MKQLLESIEALGLDPNKITLHGTMAHIPAGKKDHWASGEVSIFKPVAVDLRFMVDGQAEPALWVRFLGTDMQDEDAFWSAAVVPSGLDAKGVVRLARGFIEHHRPLTNEIHSNYEIIENDPQEIGRILAKRTELKLELQRLACYMDLDSGLFASMFFVGKGGDEAQRKAQKAQMMDMRFERDSLLADFRQEPCDRDLYGRLFQDYVARDMVGVGFSNYYTWYRNSEKKFGGNAPIGAETRDLMTRALTVWAAVGDKASPQWLQDKQSLFLRNFEVHPLHEKAVRAALSEVFTEMQGSQPAPNESNLPRPRG